MTPKQAKDIVAKELKDAGIEYTKLIAKNVSFQDLARENRYFVKIHGINLPEPKLQKVKKNLKGKQVCLDI